MLACHFKTIMEGAQLVHEDEQGLWRLASPGGMPHTAAPGRAASQGKGWCASGRYFASLHSSGSGLAGAVYDAQLQRWLPEQQILERAPHAMARGRARFSECGTLVAACAVTPQSTSRGVLAVFAAARRFVRLVPLPSTAASWTWLPGRTAILVYSSHSLACVHLEPGAAPAVQEVQVEWVQAPGAHMAGSKLCLGALPSGGTAVILHCVCVQESTVTVELALHSCSADLAQLSTAQAHLQLPADASATMLCTTVQACHRAVAACFIQIGTWVWQLESSNRLGGMLYCVQGLCAPALSPNGGQVLAGFVGCDLCVLDCNTGASIARLSPAGLWSHRAVQPVALAWAGPFCHQLHLTARAVERDDELETMDGMVFCVVGF